MDVKITPKKLSGKVTAPPSKSAAHRGIICAMLSHGTSTLQNIGTNDDVLATLEAAKALGAQYEIKNNSVAITGFFSDSQEKVFPKTAIIDCKESGSTLRFFVPIVAALGIKTIFLGDGELPNRPMNDLTAIMEEHGASFESNSGNREILTVDGKLTAGNYSIAGNISSQYITGLLFALPLLEKNSQIQLTTPLESSPYVDLTLKIMEQFQVSPTVSQDTYSITPSRYVKQESFTVEGDYSGAAFWFAANALGSSVKISGLQEDSLQGDKAIIKLLDAMTNQPLESNTLQEFSIDAKEIPDLVPILAVVAALTQGTTTIFGAERLRIKESDRLLAISQELTKLGANITEKPDGLVIKGKTLLTGGIVDSFADHRIAMALSIAATVASAPVTVLGAECVSKSYPAFYQDFESLGGVVHVL